MLVNLFPDGGDHEFGQCMDEDGRVYSFDLVYDRQMPKAEGRAVLRNWTDVTDTWQHRSLADETANAFIWRPPSRKTALPA
ncbi:hypothetical protein ACFYNX_26055 [Streptomyces sp. NPDC007872]|uniref:hypothetical protein n=1 Tax=Streptomyces sp. NPDC007872 TaxID=3364782 RepID=UPI0036AE3CE3